ncbi:protein NRT1/ PTR FAMILY 2.13-like [Iris pallida]|uniref:Protein NRT1/ PTR FAMILY 2.13-like n=1 Tax=Iris pallida TaxID=29817 RepID=A0AAX6I506_IRIPA|nr:protein NRT1/ PTR FAMILY 2.13-like [Iris pallida]
MSPSQTPNAEPIDIMATKEKSSCTTFFFQSSAIMSNEEDVEADRRKPGGWKCMPFIIGNETFERVATTGLTANFTVFLVTRFHMEQVAAANVSNIFSGTTNFAPLIGAFLSDAYLGRFRTLAYSSVATLLGLIVLTLTTVVPRLQPPSCSTEDQLAGKCVGPSKNQLGVLVLSLALLVVGAAGVRPCSLPFGVDQFDRNTEKGRRGLNSYFNWYYCTSTAGVLVALTVIVYVQSNISWPVGLGIPTGLMFLAIVFFFLGTRLYVHVPPEGSVFSGIAQVLVAAGRKRSVPLPAPEDVLLQQEALYSPAIRSDRITKLPLTLQFRFLNKAAVICEGEVKEDGTVTNPWRLCSVQQVEEVKCVLRIAPICASGIICFIALSQQWTFSVLQSLRMDRHIGPHFEIPPASIGTISLLALSIFIPIYDQIIIPLARRITGVESGITLLQRQGVGMVISAGSMVVAGLVERRRRESSWAHGGANGMSPLSAMWLAPQLVLMGVGEAFNAVGLIEFYNRQFPEQMQTLANALFYCSLAGANYVSSFLVVIIHKNTSWLNSNINLGRVDYFYYVIAAMGLVNFFYFLVCAHFYRYRGVPEVKLESEEMKVVNP